MEKILKRFLMVMMAVLAMSAMTACGSDDDDDEPGSSDYAKRIAGTYTGEMSSGGYVIDDTYVVNIYRISNTVVGMNADFFDGTENFNVSYANGTYSLKSGNHTNMTTTITGKNIMVTFLNNAGTITTFSGKRD